MCVGQKCCLWILLFCFSPFDSNWGRSKLRVLCTNHFSQAPSLLTSSEFVGGLFNTSYLESYLFGLMPF